MMETKNYKVVVFDFDGTLTYKQDNIWKSIWQMLGYDVSKESYYSELFCKFINKEIDHKTWCELTCEKFKEKGFSSGMLDLLVKKITLLPGIGDTFKTLIDNQIPIFIVSGNISQVIIKCLQDKKLIKYFNTFGLSTSDTIYANNIFFDSDSKVIKSIIGTNYDFEGKAKFINDLKRKSGFQPKDILYICDDDYNDGWVTSHYCDILYINSKNQENLDKSKGPVSMPKVSNLTQILTQIFPTYESST